MEGTELQSNETVDQTDDDIILRRRTLIDTSEMDITPMIDITFLLLIYFLVASHIDSDTAVRLPPANHGVAIAAKKAVILTVAQGKSEKPLIYKGDGKISENLIATSDLKEQEEQIIDYVEKGLSGEGGEVKEFVLIKAERGVKHRVVSRVARAIGSIEEVQLFVAVLEEQ